MTRQNEMKPGTPVTFKTGGPRKTARGTILARKAHRLQIKVPGNGPDAGTWTVLATQVVGNRE